MNHREFTRPLNLLALAVAFSAPIAAPLGAQTPLPGYAPLSARYRLVSNTQATQTMMGQTRNDTSSTDQLSTIVVAKGGSGLTLTMTLDSLSAKSNAPEPMPDVNAALGLKLTAAMAPDGKVSDSKVTDKTGLVSESPFAANMRSVLPRLKVGATPGATWSDTLTTTRSQNGGTVTTATVNNFTLVGDTTVAGTKGWKVVAASTGTVSGTGSQGGADFTIKGSIVGGGTFVITAGASLLAADLASDINMMVDVPMASLQIPIIQKQSTKINRLP